ncbi:ribosomal protein S18 acetylase RimI-like enzyme [Pacificibacter maritimus]|uniref:Ribosomal protein S18 acetylase RimI-like enzyme n=1 Tax=Pacificibacter maritimus TaxID=762213 RepID=A0A3N4VDK7_9RHOB|nr:GNAT family N-acetyltransferase [Pacificibacter maritimus]RPE71024.1 ribosomal protein S18 acetylase RimI-like enzyme [Pacificibacter maritimus]
MSKDITLRPATLNDTHAIATVQVDVWKSAYKGIVPDALIDRMSVFDREKGWTKILSSYAENGLGACFVAEIDGEIQGFASCGHQRDPDLEQDYPGEISAIYVQDAQQRCGIGRRLMKTCFETMNAMGLQGAALWVLAENQQARSFYTALGGELITQRVEDQPDGTLSEVAYGWPKRSDLS